MAPFRRNNYLRPVKTEKHEGTWSNLAQNASTTQNITLVNAVTGEPVGATDVETGSHVKWIYIEFNLNGVNNSGASQVFHWLIYKSPKGAITMDPLLYDTTDKSLVLKRGMEMLPEVPLDSGGTVQTKRQFTIKIPKFMQRVSELDLFRLSYRSSSASGINYCGFFIFKEFK